MKLETLSPKINLHVLMLLKMTPYNEIGPHNISQMPGVNIQVSSYKKFEVTHVSKRGIYKRREHRENGNVPLSPFTHNP